MMGLDIYLASISDDEMRGALQKVHPKRKTSSPILCWDIYMNHYQKMLARIQKQAEIDQLNMMSNMLGCAQSFDFIHDKTYDALVFTSSDQTILWVSGGFATMTGYSKKFAVGKKPYFLQGPNTSDDTRRSIKKQLQSGRSFSETIINYRKDQSEYACEIELFPVKGNEGDTKGFLAVERKVEPAELVA